MIELRISGMDELVARLNRLADIGSTGLMESIGGEVESQVRRRIQEEKRGPDGVAWKPWSPAYAGSKHGHGNHRPHPHQLTESQGHSILQLHGHLLDSIESISSDREASVGSGLEYAERHQKTRPYLGLSERNENEIRRIIADHIMGVLAS